MYMYICILKVLIGNIEVLHKQKSTWIEISRHNKQQQYPA